MKKVLIVGLTDNPGGIENVIMNFYRRIDKTKIQFDFICTTESLAYRDEIKEYGGNIIKITGRTTDYFAYKRAIKEFFKLHSKEYDAIWVNMCNITNLDYLKLAKKNNIKVRILHSHNSQNMYSKIVEVVHFINKMFVKKYATDFWSCSEEAGKWFFSEKIRKSEKYRVIKNCIDTDKYKFNSDIRKKYRNDLGINDKIVVGHVGRFQKQKNHTYLIDIFNELCKLNNNYVLLLIGDGEERINIETKVNQLGLQDNVVFLGVRNDVDKIIQVVDIFVFPSLFEGFGLALLEAETVGIPVYATKDTITPEVKLSNNMFEISLEDSPRVWAEVINSNLSIMNNSADVVRTIKEKGYDIGTETEKIEQFFEEC